MQEFRHLDWNEILQQVQSHCTSHSAKLLAAKLSTLPSAKAAMESVADIFSATPIVAGGSRPYMESLDLFEPWFVRVKKSAVLKTLELKDVRHFCLETLAFSETLKLQANDWSKSTLQKMMNAEEPLSAIDQILTPGGEIRSDASEALYRLFREKEDLARQISSLLDKAVKAHDMANFLQDKYVTTREGRWVLPIRSGHQHFVPGVIHGSSQTKQTVYIEPEGVVPINNRLRQVEVEIEDEIERLLTELSLYLHQKAEEFLLTKETLLNADFLLAKAQFCLQIDAKEFQFSQNEIFLNEVKHPLLQLSQKKPVPNTVQLDEEKSVLILSGPNAGGKTVLLKSIGLAAQMARCGLPICAEDGSRLPFFEKIIVGIGDSQDVGEELSTFAAHLLVLQEAASLNGRNHLILIDEICGATDPEEGSALARSFIERFAQNNCFSVITSHLGPLKSGWPTDGQVINGSLEYDAKSGRPTYHFLSGIPGDSLAIQTARRIGIEDRIINRSIELLSPTTQKRLAGLEEIDRLRSDVNILRDSLKAETQKARAEQSRYEKLIQQLEQEKEKILSKTARDAEKKIEDLISQSKVEKTFERHRQLQEIKTTLPEIVKSKPPASGPIQSSEDFARHFPTGSKVFIASLGQDGIVQSSPNSKGEVMVLSNSMRLSLPWTELKAPSQAQNPTAQILRRSSNVQVSLVDSDKTLDLRGKTVEEAVSELEMHLDQAAIHKEDRIKIIHGHGTEALKKAVRTYLSRSVYVKKWKAGSPEQGGDGVTWAEISDES